MHDRMLGVVVNVCRGRIKEGDCPTVQSFSTEILEEAVVQLADKLKFGTEPLPVEQPQEIAQHLRLVLQDCEYWRTRYAGPDYIPYPSEAAARAYLDSLRQLDG